MSNAKTAAARLRAANEKHTAWFGTRARLEAERDRLQASLPELKRVMEAAEAEKADALAGYVGGSVDQAEVVQKRKACIDAADRLTEQTELLDAIVRGLRNHNDIKFEIDAELRAAKIAYGEALADEQITIIAGNRKLREDLLSAFIAFAYPEGADWDIFLRRVFRVPSEDDGFDARVDAFQAKHVKPLTQ